MNKNNWIAPPFLLPTGQSNRGIFLPEVPLSKCLDLFQADKKKNVYTYLCLDCVNWTVNEVESAIRLPFGRSGDFAVALRSCMEAEAPRRTHTLLARGKQTLSAPRVLDPFLIQEA